MNEADLNDPLNWYVADSLNDYNVRVDPRRQKDSSSSMRIQSLFKRFEMRLPT